MRYSLVLVFSCVLLFACREQAAAPVTETADAKTEQSRIGKPGAAVQLRHRLTAPVELAQPVTVELAISSASAAANVNVQVSVDDNISLLSEQSEWQLTLNAETNPTMLPLEVALQSGKQGFIHVFVTESKADGGRSRSFAVPLRLPETEAEAAEKPQNNNPDIIEMPAEEKIR